MSETHLSLEQVEALARGCLMANGCDQANAVAVANGKVDAATIVDRIFDAAVKKGLIKEQDVQVVWRSSPIPESPMVWRKDLRRDSGGAGKYRGGMGA